MKIGDEVRLKIHGERTTKTAILVAKYPDIKGGVRLDRLLNGFYSWNEADLVKVNSKGGKGGAKK